ncbi:sulfurtransferase TusA family protein [Acuticoccus sp. I52.16.1]|uniref:sulfurtransferase TusA family protein n=1 Tax=Acuticoccus sp. I52.16.1 TaxID=2928472 RepID=UPI001FD25CEF|nr:sulfurtransferase TusA family protein [Acuticoccus sp. I52.16.1]UOM34416.1 sulfurtransferase TusA family protein [Acuticoccus sp. I52.16.1]
MADPPPFDADCDTRGQRCPIPVLKARKRLKPLPSGAVLRLLSDDPLSRLDVANFCREDGHTLLETTEADATLAFFIAKA